MHIKKRVEEIFDELVQIRRDFHMYPELSGKEIRTSDKICEYLDEWNIEYERGIADTGVVGIIRGKSQGKTVAVRADMDALPILEDNGKDFKSKNIGVMHACGHDVHTSILLGTAKILKEMEEHIQGNIKLFFQPAEEAIGGAERMVKEGCMGNPHVDYVIGLHVMPYLEVGEVELKYGKLNAQSGSVTIKVHGKSGHAAYPNTAVDAIVIAGNVVSSLQTLVSRNISPLDSLVLSLGTINGGTKNNIITDEVAITGTLRTLDSETRQYAKDRISSIVENTARAYGGSGEAIFKDGYIALVNDNRVVDLIKENAISVVGEEKIKMKEFPSLGGEDFSYFLQNTEGAFFHLGCGNKEKGITEPLHNVNFDVDENCMKTGVELQVKNVLSLLKY
ncbi:MAG: amidohydrolase [Anaeromicrobium sp.]|jgi:amidohydrolase|uniref:M20 metallopeptidase family protein n=1 Tax=Anaeromicrobium sp. TaxID=1929132 RepID=UPI0025F828E5|nr:amidohydrolase [Anaeromicrobium sp.]MCT4593986.1 amidohydrolase [Anaeromicrobium sp.]